MLSTEPYKTLSEALPPGLLATRQWFLGQGFHVHTLDNALKSGELVALAPGVYTKPGLALSWQSVSASLARILDKPVYIGGLSALELRGGGHYGRQQSPVHLYGFCKAPSWLSKLPLKTEFRWHNAQKLWGQDPEVCLLGAKNWWEGLPPYFLAEKGQALMEVLDQVPREISFEHADLLTQSLTSLSPGRLDQLLHHCRSIKAKRLLFFFARRQNYPWTQRLTADDYDLGTGKRMLVKGGRLDRELLITVPEELHESL